MGERGTRKLSYKLSQKSKYNYAITVPKWLVDTLGVNNELYWTKMTNRDKTSVVLTKQIPEELLYNQVCKKIDDYVLITDDFNPNINHKGNIHLGYNFYDKRYFLNVNKNGKLSIVYGNTLEEVFADSPKSFNPPQQLVDELKDFVSCKINCR